MRQLSTEKYWAVLRGKESCHDVPVKDKPPSPPGSNGPAAPDPLAGFFAEIDSILDLPPGGTERPSVLGTAKNGTAESR